MVSTAIGKVCKQGSRDWFKDLVDESKKNFKSFHGNNA